MKSPMDLLQAKGVSRRDFVKLMAATTAALGLPLTMQPKVAEAVENAMKKPPVIWLEGQDCAGCSESTLASLNPSAEQLILDMISLRYHETVMAATGDVAKKAFEDTYNEGNYVLIVEGSIPKADDRYCVIGGTPFRQHVMEAASKASAIVAIGACATYGGVVRTTPSQGMGVSEFVKDKPVINLPLCPVKPTTLFGTLVYYLTYKSAPPMDKYNRPLAFFGDLMHDNCPRRGHFDTSEFLQDWNDPSQKEWCLLLKGCKGPQTYSDCGQVWWNDNTSYCIQAGSPCAGCSQPEFYDGFSPLYQKQEGFNTPGINPDTVGKVIGGAAALGVVAHLGAKAINSGKGDDKNKGKGVSK